MTRRRDVRASLHAAVDAALDAAEAELRAELGLEAPPADSSTGPPRAQPPPPTSLQVAQNRLLELVQDVIEGSSEREARAWFSFLIDTAARNALRASSRRPAA